VRGDQVLRALSATGLEDWRALQASPLLERNVAAGRLVPTEELSHIPDGLADAVPRGTAGVLRHERVPVVSYPYEWTFAMLRDAALLQLDLLLEAIDAGLILKDSSPYNVQFRGAQATFVDIGSFERLREGEPWVGYRQFCMLYLYPLLLAAYKGIAFQPWLRGAIDGIPPAEADAVMSLRDHFRRGVFTHVHLHSKLEARAGSSGRDTRADLKRAGFKTELIKANVRKLRKLVARLDWGLSSSEWSQYTTTTSYDDEGAAIKESFIRDAVAGEQWDFAWDLGCNTGNFSRIAAESARSVVAVDADRLVVDRLYQELRDEGNDRILPLTMNLADPSPGLGWRGRERRALEDRGRPGFVLALALVHHIAITANVPMREFLGWLADLGATVVVEYVGREDPMTRKLLAGKGEDANPDYDRAPFERELAERFDVRRSVEIAGGERVLYLAVPR
jgi:hypothetical protein